MGFDELLALAPAGAGRWTAPGTALTDEPRAFGGLLLAYTIVAASEQTGRCHSVHALFIGAGSPSQPFEIAVERIRDGRSFTTRRIEIRQRERLLLAAFSSHHDGDEGPEHQVAMPDVPGPEILEDQRAVRARRADAQGRTARRYLAEEMLDARPVEPFVVPDGAEPSRAVWFRPRVPLGEGQAIHRAAIAFASDMGLVRVGLQAHGREAGALQAASLDHGIWFHRDAMADDWMLHVQRSPAAAHGRGFSHAAIFSRDGRLVAHVTQEFLARRKRV